MLELIISKYLLNALLIALVSIGYGYLKSKLGEDRAGTIKDAILAAMLWAEEELGIGNGSQIKKIGRESSKDYDEGQCGEDQ
jgi:hypothetical protein